jgi:hypothetical protein
MIAETSIEISEERYAYAHKDLALLPSSPPLLIEVNETKRLLANLRLKPLFPASMPRFRACNMRYARTHNSEQSASLSSDVTVHAELHVLTGLGLRVVGDSVLIRHFPRGFMVLQTHK